MKQRTGPADMPSRAVRPRRLSAPAGRLLGRTVGVPLVIALGVCLWALRADQHALTRAADVRAAAEAYDAWRAGGLDAARVTLSSTGRSGVTPRDRVRDAPAEGRGPPPVRRGYAVDSVRPDAALTALLERTDGPTGVTGGGARRRAAAPIRDADEWDIVAALVVTSNDPSPVVPLLHVPATARARWAVLAALAGWLVIATIGASLARGTRPGAQRREAGSAWLFVAPSLVHLLVFSIAPMAFALWLSMHEWGLLDETHRYVGAGNYIALSRDAGFLRALLNTAVYVLFVPVGMAVALGLALFVNRPGWSMRALRTVFFLPYVTSFVAISLVWKWMYEPELGLLNRVLGSVGVPPQPWLTSPATALPSLMLMSVWMYAGYMMLIFLAGLQSIPASLYESARIDGAGAWQQFRRITLPLLRPTTVFILVTMVIFMFQVFTAVYVMTEGGPLQATDVVVYHIYRNAWEYLRMGYASAMAWVLFAVVFVLTLVQYRWIRRGDVHG
jgi:multiple sugar transport system permease protein